MPGLGRINFAGLFWSCAAHAAIIGGFFLVGSDALPRASTAARSSAPLLLDLLPLDAGDAPQDDPNRFKRLDSSVLIPRIGKAPAAMDETAPRAVLVPTSISSGLKYEAAVPAVDVGSDNPASRAASSDYQRRLYDAVARNTRYPAGARRLHLSGVTQIAFRLDRAGTVLDSWVQESSGSELLDDAALDALARAQPLPSIPPNLPPRMDFVIEIDSAILQQAATPSVG